MKAYGVYAALISGLSATAADRAAMIASGSQPDWLSVAVAAVLGLIVSGYAIATRAFDS